MTVIVDTGFLSSLVKIGRVDLIQAFFPDQNTVIPEQVFAELKRSDIITEALPALFTDTSGEEAFIEIRDYDLAYEHPGLGRGERACIDLCGGHDIILMDDRDAKRAAHDEGKACFDLPTFLYACKKNGLLDEDSVETVIQDLREEDHYRFTEDVENLLLEG
ncbi:MAG: hypothetical protein ABEI97_05345 [Candidatus Nanohaloarchaea archaeon]